MIPPKVKKLKVYDGDTFDEAVDNFSTGEKIAIHIIRNGTRLIRSITLN